MTARTAAALLAATATLALPAASANAADWAPFTRVATAPFVSPAGVAMGPDGTVTAAYVRKDASNGSGNVEVRVKPPGGAYGVAKQLTTSGTAGWPRMARDAQGNVAIVWTEYLSGTHVLRGATKPAAGAFTASQSIADTGSDVEFPNVDIADGKAVASWMQNGRVRAATAAAGQPFQVHDPLTPPLFDSYSVVPVVAAGPGGAAVVAWITRPSASSAARIQAVARPAGGQFAPLSDVAQPPVHPGYLRIAMSGDGRATLGWIRYDYADESYVLESASRGKTGDFGGTETVASIGNENNSYFGLDTSADGTSVLAWLDGGQLRYAVRPEGGEFGATQTVPGSHGGLSTPQLSSGADGSVWAAWRGSLTGPIHLETARIAPDGSSGSAVDIAAPANPGLSDNKEGFYDIAADGHGNAAVLWTHNVAPSGSGHQAVETRIFDAEPPALTNVQVPASALTGQPVTMTASATDGFSPVTIRWTLSHKLPGGQGPTIVRKFDTPGTYSVLVEAVDAAGNSVRESRQIEVGSSPNPPTPCPEGQVCE
jgi:PKD domain